MSASSAPYSTTLRARGTIELAPKEAAGALRLRVEMPENWDVVGVVAMPTEPVMTLKVRALEAMCPQAELHEDFVLKLRGWEVLNEHATLAEAGAVDGSIFLLTNRRKQPIR
jgi:hypothetical protein